MTVIKQLKGRQELKKIIGMIKQVFASALLVATSRAVSSQEIAFATAGHDNIGDKMIEIAKVFGLQLGQYDLQEVDDQKTVWRLLHVTERLLENINGNLGSLDTTLNDKLADLQIGTNQKILEFQNSITGIDLNSQLPTPSIHSVYLAQEIVWAEMLDILREIKTRVEFLNERIEAIEKAFGIEYIGTLGAIYNEYVAPLDSYYTYGGLKTTDGGTSGGISTLKTGTSTSSTSATGTSAGTAAGTSGAGTTGTGTSGTGNSGTSATTGTGAGTSSSGTLGGGAGTGTLGTATTGTGTSTGTSGTSTSGTGTSGTSTGTGDATKVTTSDYVNSTKNKLTQELTDQYTIEVIEKNVNNQLASKDGYTNQDFYGLNNLFKNANIKISGNEKTTNSNTNKVNDVVNGEVVFSDDDFKSDTSSKQIN